MSVGALTVSLQAEIAQFTSAMEKASAIAEQRMKQIDQTVGIVKSSLTALGAGFAAGLTVDKVKESIEKAIQSASGLQEVAERTGATVEKLSGLASVAKLSGTDTEALATGLQKLSKSMVDAQDGGAKSQAAFNAIGISVKDLKGLKPDEAFQLIAQKMATYADGAEKTAIAQALFSKSGANLLPVMKDLADVGDLQIKVTAEQAAQANEYEKNLRRLEMAQGAIWKMIGFQVLPVMNAFTKAMLESATQTDGVKGAVDGLAKDNTIRAWAEGAATTVGFVVDAFDGVSRAAQIAGKTIGAVAAITLEDYKLAPAIFKGLMADIDAIASKQLFSDRLKAQLAKMNLPGAPESGGPRPTPNYRPNSAARAANDDPAKALMDGIFKQQDLIVAAQRKALAEDEAMLQQSYSQQYLTAAQFYEGKKQLIEDDLQHELEAYDKEMSAAQAYINSADSETKRQQGRNQMAQAAAKYLNAQADAGSRLAKVNQDAVAPLRAFELAIAAVAHQHELENAAMQFGIDMLGRNTLEVQKLTAARNLDLQLEQEIYKLTQQGYKGDELATRVAAATAQKEAQKAIAIAQITSAYDLQRDSIFGAHEAFRKYVEDSTNGAAQMENVVGGAFKGMENALVEFVKTGKLNFSSLVDSIIADVARMVIQQQITGPLAGWAMGGLTSLFSGGIGAVNSFDDGSMAALLGLPRKAGGGPVSAGTSYLVGEKGPEIFTAPSSGQIIPNDQIGGGGGGPTIVIHNTIGDVANKSDVIGGMQTVRAQIIGELSRSRTYGGAA